MRWDEGQWPVVNGGLPIDTLVKANTLPTVALAKHVGASADFAPATGKYEWVYLQNPIMANYATPDVKVKRLYPHGTLTENNQPTFLGRRQESARFSLETSVLPKGDVEAGLTVYQIHEGHLDLVVSSREISLRCKLKSIDYVVKSVPRAAEGYVKLRIHSNGEMYYFDCSQNGTDYQELGAVNCSLLSTEVAGGFTGVTLGMFAEGAEKNGYADFSGFRYNEQ